MLSCCPEEHSIKWAIQIIMVTFWKMEYSRSEKGKIEWILSSQGTALKQMLGFVD